MVRYTLRVLGFPVLSVDCTELEYVGDEDESHIEGGSGHNFERDHEPLSPTSHLEWEWVDKTTFGFGGVNA
jgi:hypothetical protein